MSDNFANFNSDWDLDDDLESNLSTNDNTFENNLSISGNENNDNMSSQNISSEQSQSNSDDWNLTQNTNTTWNLDEDNDNENNSTNTSRKIANLSYKQTGILLAGVFIFIGLIFFVLSNVHIKKPNNQTNKSGVQQGLQNSSDVQMYAIGEQYTLDYSGRVSEGQAKVMDKKKYLLNKQVVYEIKLVLQMDVDQIEVSYFCNYASFTKVEKGDIVKVQYQSVQDGYISINSISQ